MEGEIARTASPQPGPTVVAASDCYAIGQQVAAQNGGTLARLYSSGGEKFDGQTSTGLPISLTR
ncbi:MAG: hypothetical protein E5V46_24225 [Mesorhizobium sp.]|nr:MAG: hypothetical protein E5V46_24225 [Mesorhizobium sp.]